MTLGGLALGAGMLVDNAIVVIESIFRNQENGLSLKDSVIQGTSEVGSAIIASTLTTIVVFLPIVYLQGASGELFKDQAWTVTFSLLSSLFVAILVIPTLYERVFRKSETKNQAQEVKVAMQEKTAHAGKLITTYTHMLNAILDKRWMVVGISVIMVIGSYMLLPLIGAEFMPKTEGNSFNISVKMNEGTRLERTSATVAGIEMIETFVFSGYPYIPVFILAELTDSFS